MRGWCSTPRATIFEIEIPAQYVAYLLGNVPASEDYAPRWSAAYDTTQLAGLEGRWSRFDAGSR